MIAQHLRLFMLPVMLLAASSTVALASQATPEPAPLPSTDCDVTEPNGHVPPESPYTDPNDWYGSGTRDASFWLLMARGTGVVERQAVLDAHAINLYADGYPYSVWLYRGEDSDEITVAATSTEGRSVSSDAFMVFPEESYPAPGMAPLTGHLPTDGCWTFTATNGNDTLTWTSLLQSPFAGCPVTSGANDDGSLPQYVVTGFIPGDIGTPDVQLPADPDDYYGENGLYIALGDPDHLIRSYPVDSPLVSESGAISDRFMWFRDDEAAGDLTVTVAPGRYWFPEEPHVQVPEHTTVTRGLEFSWITFPGPGCWEVTGTSGGVSITFTVRLEIVPAGE